MILPAIESVIAFLPPDLRIIFYISKIVYLYIYSLLGFLTYPI